MTKQELAPSPKIYLGESGIDNAGRGVFAAVGGVPPLEGQR